MSAVIAYHPFDGANGLRIENGGLQALAGGRVMGEGASPYDLDTMLELYLAPEALPELSFSYTQPRELELELDAQLPLDSLMRGHLSSADDWGYWSAEKIGNNVFLLNERLPEAARPWAADEDRGYGWQIRLPGFLAVDLDPVLRRRAALFIEEALYGMSEGLIDDQIYQRKITNLFSAEDPMWPVPLPVILGDPLPGTLEVA